MADTPPMSQVDREALVAAAEALRDYACHGGEGVPCLRTTNQCLDNCGKPAGDALLLVEAALLQAKDHPNG